MKKRSTKRAVKFEVPPADSVAWLVTTTKINRGVMAHVIPKIKGFPEGPKLIRPFDLRQLGYTLDGTRKEKMTAGYELWPVLEEDTQREVSLCFLLQKGAHHGVVLPNPICYYMGVRGE